jgi:hypothetical protein
MFWLAAVPFAWMIIALPVGLLVGRCIRVQPGGEPATERVRAIGALPPAIPSASDHGDRLDLAATAAR